MAGSQLTLVVSTACHLCDDAKEALAEIAAADALDVRIVEAASPEGWALLGRYGAGLMPLAILDGEWFSAGRLPRKKLSRALAARSVRA